jgi:hypothetical protein
MSNRLSLLAIGLILLSGCSSGIYLRAPASGGAATAPTLAPSVSATVSVSLSADQAAAVRAWYSNNQPRSQGRGRGRGNGLPPGIAKNLARGKSLPPGIAKQYLPQNLVVQLPRVGSGLEYIVAAGKLLLVEAATQVVREVLLDALNV